jgi:RimJ/RimL family protein N-acetyltransferase
VTLPRLAGERVTLVPIPHVLAVAVLAGDATKALADLGLTAAVGWPHEDTADGMRPLAEHGQPGEVSEWLVVIDAQVVGEVGWRGGPGPDGDAELGYGLAASARGRGLGTEAVGVLSAWAERQPGVRRLVARVLPGNEPSWRLLVRLGFREEGAEPPYRRYVRDSAHVDRSPY